MREHLIPSFHRVRRTVATRALEAGMSIEQVQELGNWKSYEIVGRYAVMTVKLRKAGFKKLDRVL